MCVIDSDCRKLSTTEEKEQFRGLLVCGALKPDLLLCCDSNNGLGGSTWHYVVIMLLMVSFVINLCLVLYNRKLKQRLRGVNGI
ncbi:hypothetical protein TCAL_15214 [Tigriopus californicus]|uniref:Uncharacterized protein n=1 Tax=Tigriopus californicus TaxID=6832 RepID=A0A553NBN0_TIGCA|nr:hypothetical protein TCAL_15214 [Tigriopus californicus]